MSPQELQLQEKQESTSKDESTRLSRYYLPHVDIHESTNALLVTLEMPGVDKQSIDIKLKGRVLTITGSINLNNYEGLEPVYTEYDVGNYTRSFTLSSDIDSEQISAPMNDGVLAVTLPKQKETSRKISVN